MGVHIGRLGQSTRIVLTGWDRALNLRSHLIVTDDAVRTTNVASRSELDSGIDHRHRGRGTHRGTAEPTVPRIGTMSGRGVVGPQFWAVPSSESDVPLLILELADHEFARVVLDVDDPTRLAAEITRRRAPTPEAPDA